jgi:peptidoglycan/LPS O-acetylase OafA/YrhL
MNKSIAYRPEIDGLRAIAVFAVILYHAGIVIKDRGFFEGGFIGVDVFFVIFGYLITSILLKEMHAAEFSFLNFYERRVRRILPALFTVMFASLPFGMVYLFGRSFEDFTNSIASSLLFVSNLYFWKSGEAYAAESSLLRPFLHTWSLSVEEQFYVLFPIFLLLCFRYFKKHLAIIIVVGLFMSLAMADWGSRNEPSMSFYFFPTRGWELLAGSLLAKWEGEFGRSQHKILTPLMPVVGLFLVAHAIVFFNDQMFHPSVYTLSPVIGVMFLIWFCQKGELVTDFLSSRLFVGFGLISYSLYLWHYPVFAFARVNEILSGSNGVTQASKILLVVILLSVLTYFLVEKPFRNRRLISRKNAFVSVSVAGFILVYSALYLEAVYVEGFPILAREQTSPLYHLNKAKQNNKLCDSKVGPFCSFNDTGKKGSVFLIGDSHMQSLQESLRRSLIRDDINLISMAVGGGCFYNPTFNLVDRKTKGKKTECDSEMQEERTRAILSKPGSIVILGGRLPLYLSEYGFNNLEGGVEQQAAYIYNYQGGGSQGGLWKTYFEPVGLETSSQKQRQGLISENIVKSTYDLLNKGYRVILLYPIPEVGWDVTAKMKYMFLQGPKVLLKYIFSQGSNASSEVRRGLSDANITTSFDTYKKRTEDSFRLLNSIEHPNVLRVYPHELFCDNQIENRCVTHNDKDIFYFDSNHPSIKGSEMIVELMINEIEGIGWGKGE